MFDVHSADDDSVIWSSALGDSPSDELTGDTLYRADFTEFCSTGRFYLEVPGLGKSAPFTIGPDVYNDLLTRSMIGMYGQRCGTEVHIQLDGRFVGSRGLPPEGRVR